MNYVLVKSSFPSDFERMVSEKIEDGYRTKGNAFTEDGVFYQAMELDDFYKDELNIALKDISNSLSSILLVLDMRFGSC